MLIGRRIGRPGLLGAVARTAVVAGTASMTVNAVNRHAQQRSEEQQEAALYEQQQLSAQQAPAVSEPAAAPAPASGTFDDMVDQLTKLAELHASGALSDDEFAGAKKKLLGR